ncbi:MAG: tRNA uridine(34) 5-carboxymethylaminomethyl modification radical SAM/GNAT enzyme Elp3 [Patescibacteria group bacterium]
MKTQPSPPRNLINEIIMSALDLRNLTRETFSKAARKKLSGTIYAFPTSSETWSEYRRLIKNHTIQKNERLERVLRVKDVRTDSGVAPITVLTKPYPCPGKCVYCPNDVKMPKSYIPTEPAAARALSLKFDPYDQVKKRVQILEQNGHEAKKIELIIKGGTWSAYTWEYRQWFVKRCFDAANQIKRRISSEESEVMSHATLKEAQDANEKAAYRIIGLTIETRPDWVNGIEIARLRELGCTRVELGVQTLRDEILEITKRGHKLEATVRAVALLKQAGFKTDFHVLPGQPGTTPDSDVLDFKQMFDDPRFRPDMVKIYPCVVLPTAELQSWTEEGRFKPLEGNELKEMLIRMQELIPRYCRVSRMIRDFPMADISSGNKVTNLREEIEAEMKRRGIRCQCLRCREVGHVKYIDPAKVNPVLFEDWYENAGGREVFLSMEDEKRKAVFAFLRLRLPLLPLKLIETKPYSDDPKFVEYSKDIDKDFPVLRNSAFVRELHTYGRALDLGVINKNAAQHRGYGRELMELAEQIAKREGYSKMAVISGIGVREYYRKLGYRLNQTYMVKKLI